MVLLIAAAGIAYLAVRGGRSLLEPAAPHSAQLPVQAGDLTLQLPDQWRGRQMKDVSGASQRWAFGSKGARNNALFLTRYPLKRTPKDDQQTKQLKSEVQSGLARTGGPKHPRMVDEEKIGGQNAWRYSFRTKKIWIDIWLVIHTLKDKSAAYQFSCQSPPGDSGQEMRKLCASTLDSVKFSEKHP